MIWRSLISGEADLGAFRDFIMEHVRGVALDLGGVCRKSNRGLREIQSTQWRDDQKRD